MNKMPGKILECIKWDSLQEDLEEHIPTELKRHLLKIFPDLQIFHKNNEVLLGLEKPKFSEQWIERDLLLIEACLDRTWEMLNSGYWKDVPINYRYCYSLCSVMKTILLEILCSMENENFERIIKYKEMIQQIDKGILLGAPLPRNKDLLTKIASKLNENFTEMIQKNEELSDAIKISKDTICTTLYPNFVPIPHYTEPSMEKFYCDIFKPKVPALLEGCINHWPALYLWKDAKYLQKLAGSRTVPIEIGSRYTEDDWTQSLLTFSEFLKTHISNKSDKIGYLAQHQLFDQIPELKNDFSIPDYCAFSDREDCEEAPDMNAWFGPSGTVSPLHYDPKNNLLCQVFGYKRIILYSPEDNINIYPYETRMLCNTSKVDPYNPDFQKYPNFQQVQGFMCYLKPGDMLFIPPKWWHHVVGLSPSFSISFWWD